MFAKTKLTLGMVAASGVLVAAACPMTLHALAPPHGVHPEKCSSYIQSGSWVYEYNEWSLQLVPTSCGRHIAEDETPAMFYEIVKKFGDPEVFGKPADASRDRWRNVRGMIDQLTCHLTISRNKPTWNLEPYRPWVGYEATVKADCNPYIKR